MARLRTTHARRKITISRDDHGVPHVQGETWIDALYGLGMMHATDRPTQMLFGRAVALGQSAERISDQPELVEMDRFFRRFGLYRNLDEEVRALDDDIFRQLTAYCEGVNDGLKSLGRTLPMWAVGFQPRPWNQESVLLMGNLLAFGGLAISQMENERLIVELIHAGVSDAALQELFSPMLDHADFDLLRATKMSNKLSDQALELITDLPRLAGSNAWAVSAARSASGGAMLASDPHLEVNRLPSLWYEAVLAWGDDYVMGATLPGCPLFAVARTRRLGWGVTYMKGDTIDFFVEDVRKNGEAWEYRRGKKWHEFDVREETIQRKGKQPTTLKVFSNEVGTLEGDPEVLGEGYQLSVQWTGSKAGSGQSLSTWLQMVAAPNVRVGMDIARSCTQPTLCWVFADDEGRIGMQGNGRFPKRAKNHNGLVPVPAWKKENHWQGFLDTSVLPSVYNPPEGYLATANEDVSPPGGVRLVTQPVPAYRKRRIIEQLAEKASPTLVDMKSLQYDLVSLQARELLEVFLPLLPEGELKNRLAAWDCRYNPESEEAALFQRFYVNVMVEVFGHEKGIGWRRMLYLVSRVGFSIMIITAADRLLKKENSYWWKDRGKEALIRNAAEKTASQSTETWADVNQFHFADRFFGRHQVGRLLGFATAPFAMPGCHATVFQGHVQQTAGREVTFAPSYHFVADMGTDTAQTNLPGGPSESRFSRYYKSELRLWFNGDYKSLSPKLTETEKVA